MKKIVILGATVYNIVVFKKLKEAGFYTIAVDGNPNAVAAPYADEFIHLDFADKEGFLAFCESHNVDAVMPINEWGVMPAAFVSSKLNLKGNSEHTALAATDKGLMRTLWKEAGVPVPPFFIFKTLDELKSAVKSIGFPCVVKPTFSGGGGRGISVLKGEQDVEWAYQFAQPEVRYGTMICEGFVEGMELTIETISVDGEVHILAISDKEKPDLRTRVATSLNYPAKLSNIQKAIVEETIKKAVLTLGIRNGMAHSEAIINGNDLKMVETGARGGGSHIFPVIIEAVSGISAPVVFADMLTGGKPDLSVIKTNGVIYRFFNPDHGILREVQNLDTVASWPGILAAGVTKKPGDEVGNLKNSLERAGFIVATAATREEAIELANKAESEVKFVLDPIHMAQ